MSRLVAARSAAALLAIGILGGLSACGSDSSSDTTGTAASVVKKEAGAVSTVVVRVVNDLPTASADYEQGNVFHLCFSVPQSGCTNVARGFDNAYTAHGNLNEATGTLEYCCDYREYHFRAYSPNVGDSYFTMTPFSTVTGKELEGGDDWSPNQGNSETITMQGSTFVLKREYDAPYEIRFTLTAQGYPHQFD